MRATGLGCYLGIAGGLGIDPYELLRRAKIHPAKLTDPQMRLAAGAVIAIARCQAIRPELPRRERACRTKRLS
jgi:hypothetical protein